MDAGTLEHVANARPRLDARARTGGNQNDLAGAEAADDAMRDRGAAELDLALPLEGFLGILGGVGTVGIAALTTKLNIQHDDKLMSDVLAEVVRLENHGYQFESAEAS